MRLTRHAKNKMRLDDLTADQVEQVLAHPDRIDKDAEGKPVLSGKTTDGCRLTVVLGLENPDIVVTVWKED